MLKLNHMLSTTPTTELDFDRLSVFADSQRSRPKIGKTWSRKNFNLISRTSQFRFLTIISEFRSGRFLYKAFLEPGFLSCKAEEVPKSRFCCLFYKWRLLSLTD